MRVKATPKKRRIRVVICDREGVFRLGLRKLFGLEDDLRVVAQAENDLQVLGLAKKFRPDVLFISRELLGADPAGFVARLHRTWAGGKTVVMLPTLSGEDPAAYAKGGAAGVILKSDDPALFAKCAREVMEGKSWLPTGHVSQFASPPAQPGSRPLRPVDTLTRREKAIISCLVQGWRNREIAQHLRITEQTVKNHLRTVFDKVGVSDRLELALYAIHQRMELPPV